LLILLFPVLTHAQSVPALDSMVKNVIAELQASWALGVDSNTIVDIGVYNNYKKLFDINARVDDDLNFQYIPGKQSGVYKINSAPKDFDVYAHDVALQVTKLRVDTSELVYPKNYNNPDSIIMILKRTVYAEKPARYVLQDIDAMAAGILNNHQDIKFEKNNARNNQSDKNAIIDRLKQNIKKNPDSIYQFNSSSTFRITLAYTTDTLNRVKIMRIENISNILACMNDDDGDGVLNQADSLRFQFGEFTVNGAPDADLDGVADATDICRGIYGTVSNKGCPESYFITKKQLEGNVGVQYNTAKINMPELNQLGYQVGSGADATDVLQSKKGSLKNPGPSLGIYAGVDMAFFFGKKAKQKGISIGVTYARFVADYELAEPAVYTYKSTDGTDFYRRQITINALKEQIAYNVINIPLQFNYRFKLFNDNKWVMNLRAGPSLILFNSTSNYNSTIDVGGIYQIDTVNNDKITYYDYFNNSSTWNVYLTSSGINTQNTNPGAAAIFAQLGGSGNYDFASNKNYRGQKKSTRATYAFNFSLSGEYKKNKDFPIAIKFGIHGVYAPSIGSKEKYMPIERTTDEYNSIFNSNARSFYFAYGLNLGLVYSF